MKPIVVCFFASLFIFSARADDHASLFQMEVASGLELSEHIGIIDDEDQWKGLAEKLDRTDAGFAGTLAKPDGGEIKIEAAHKKSGKKWDCSVKWESGSDNPSSFVIITYTIPLDQARDVELTSGKGVISFTKLIEQIPTLNSMPNVSEFTLGPISGSTLQFSMSAPSSVEVILGPDAVIIRLFMTPTKEPLPTSGSVQWTVEKQ